MGSCDFSFIDPRLIEIAVQTGVTVDGGSDGFILNIAHVLAHHARNFTNNIERYPYAAGIGGRFSQFFDQGFVDGIRFYFR